MNEIEKLKNESKLKDKIIKLIEENDDEFSEIISNGVEITFNPFTQSASCNDWEVVPGWRTHKCVKIGTVNKGGRINEN